MTQDRAIKNEDGTVTLKVGFSTIIYRGIVLVCALASPLILLGSIKYLDDHNDQRYLRLEEYKHAKDIEDQKRILEQWKLDEQSRRVTESLDAHSKQLENITALLKQEKDGHP